MYRNYTYIDKYLDELQTDVYPQPDDKWHAEATRDIILRWLTDIAYISVLDVGCGQGFASSIFEAVGKYYAGITLGEDATVAKNVLGREIVRQDFNFLPEDFTEKFDLIFARHALEHSPMPLLTLMDWHRVSKQYLCIIAPEPKRWSHIGRNHYSVMDKEQLRWLLRRAGWEIIKKEFTLEEIRFLCQKRPRISYEGWVEAPIPNAVYMDEMADTAGDHEV